MLQTRFRKMAIFLREFRVYYRGVEFTNREFARLKIEIIASCSLPSN